MIFDNSEQYSSPMSTGEQSRRKENDDDTFKHRLDLWKLYNERWRVARRLESLFQLYERYLEEYEMQLNYIEWELKHLQRGSQSTRSTQMVNLVLAAAALEYHIYHKAIRHLMSSELHKFISSLHDDLEMLGLRDELGLSMPLAIKPRDDITYTPSFPRFQGPVCAPIEDVHCRRLFSGIEVYLTEWIDPDIPYRPPWRNNFHDTPPAYGVCVDYSLFGLSFEFEWIEPDPRGDDLFLITFDRTGKRRQSNVHVYLTEWLDPGIYTLPGHSSFPFRWLKACRTATAVQRVQHTEGTSRVAHQTRL
jgi:hypothetical protein